MDKITLSKKSVLALERLAKKVGAKTVTPEGKKKNKTQLVNSIVIASRLGKKNPALKTKKAPAKVAGRKTLNGNTTAKKVVAKKDVPEIKSFKVVNLKASNEGSRFRITDMVSGESIVIPFIGRQTYSYQEAILYLKSLGIKVVAKAKFNNGTVLLYTKDFGPRLKK
jgi:hypothetical protein